MKIAAAGNVEVPAYLVLRKKGYQLSVDGVNWVASRGTLTLIGGSPLEVLGLSSIYEERGEDWKARDAEIHDFLERYPQA